jgi:NitT/TauT family transport system ATP-binding protein
MANLGTAWQASAGDGAPAGGSAATRVRASHVAIGYTLGHSGEYLEAVRDVSLSVADGELVAVIGPSGCGKSTLVSAVAGLIPYSRGDLTIDGVPVRGPGTDRGVVFQRPALLPWRRVDDNVAYGLHLRGVPRAEARSRALSALELVELAQFADLYPYQLSGGMQQRVNLARALVSDPAILLLDEPFSALDAQTRELLQAELLRIWERTGKAGIFITHQIEEAVLLADRVVVLSAGPGSVVRATMEIDLGRPRDMSCRRNPRFAEYVEQIWKILFEELRASGAATRTVASRRHSTQTVWSRLVTRGRR